MLKTIQQISIIRTLWFNFKLLPLKQASKLPFFIGHHTKFVTLRGKIEIDAIISPGMIKIGFGNVGIIDRKNNRTLIELNGKIIFKGYANIGHSSKISVGDKGILQIGERFSISANSTIICFDSITMGNDVLFSWDILVMDSDFHPTINSLTNETNLSISRPIILGDNIWIGTRSVILKGTILPQNTIIAANSLLCKEYAVEENCVLGGIPAHVIKRNLRRKL